MPSNLIIGNTSQISKFLSDSEFKKIDSRNFSFSQIDGDWDTAILAFGENRKFLPSFSLYEEINVKLTLDTVKFLLDKCRKIIVFSTCELWDKCSGPIDLSTPFNFYDTFYARSKFVMTEEILNHPNLYPNVCVIYPFNFNSTFRSEDFLFGKVFNSILTKKKISIGDTYYYRDIFHPIFLAREIPNLNSHTLIGSGRLTYINDFIRELYAYFDLNYEELVEENLNNFKEYDLKYEYYLRSNRPKYEYKSLFLDTVRDIKSKMNQIVSI